MASAPPEDPSTIDWRPTPAQWVGGAVGVAIGLGAAGSDVPRAAVLAFPVAYGVACAVIPRMRGVVRHRRRGQFAAHELAMAAIAGGWLAAGEIAPAAFNGSWLASAGLWWWRTRQQDPAT